MNGSGAFCVSIYTYIWVAIFDLQCSFCHRVSTFFASEAVFVNVTLVCNSQSTHFPVNEHYWHRLPSTTACHKHVNNTFVNVSYCLVLSISLLAFQGEKDFIIAKLLLDILSLLLSLGTAKSDLSLMTRAPIVPN